MSLKRLLDDSGLSKNNRTIIRVNRRRNLDADLEEEEAISTFSSLNNKYEATAKPPYLLYLYDTRPNPVSPAGVKY